MVEANCSKRAARGRVASRTAEPPPQEVVGERFLRIAQLIEGDRPIVPVSRSTLWRWVQKGTFPKPVKLSDQVTAWRASEVDRWAAQVAETA